MSTNNVIDNRVSVNAIRKANQKRINRKYTTSDNNRINGEIHIKFSNGLTTKQVIITKEQISTAYRKAIDKDVKKL